MKRLHFQMSVAQSRVLLIKNKRHTMFDSSFLFCLFKQNCEKIQISQTKSITLREPFPAVLLCDVSEFRRNNRRCVCSRSDFPQMLRLSLFDVHKSACARYVIRKIGSITSCAKRARKIKATLHQSRRHRCNIK